MKKPELETKTYWKRSGMTAAVLFAILFVIQFAIPEQCFAAGFIDQCLTFADQYWFILTLGAAWLASSVWTSKIEDPKLRKGFVPVVFITVFFTVTAGITAEGVGFLAAAYAIIAGSLFFGFTMSAVGLSRGGAGAPSPEGTPPPAGGAEGGKESLLKKMPALGTIWLIFKLIFYSAFGIFIGSLVGGMPGLLVGVAATIALWVMIQFAWKWFLMLVGVLLVVLLLVGAGLWYASQNSEVQGAADAWNTAKNAWDTVRGWIGLGGDGAEVIPAQTIGGRTFEALHEKTKTSVARAQAVELIRFKNEVVDQTIKDQANARAERITNQFNLRGQQ